MCICALSSGLLFVAIGPSNSFPSSFQYSQQYLNVPRYTGSNYISPPSSPVPHKGDAPRGLAAIHAEGTISGTGSEAGSIGTERGTNTSIWGVRKRALEISKLLEGRLEGFELSSRDRR